jgi:hypothetical protein
LHRRARVGRPLRYRRAVEEAGAMNERTRRIVVLMVIGAMVVVPFLSLLVL